jgi:ubiquinone/menaquinone biosynthesis C-methylase UbiE
MQDAVQFFVGSGLDMPFGDECFDVVWTQNASMNIPDKARLVAEQRRVLRRGGWLVFQEIFAGPGGDLLCPGHVIRPPASWFQPSTCALSCARLVSTSESGFR